MKKLFFLLFLTNSLIFLGQNTRIKFDISNDKAFAVFTKTPALKNAHYGISIRNLSTGKELVNINANHSFAPASNLKLLYTLAAIHTLG